MYLDDIIEVQEAVDAYEKVAISWRQALFTYSEAKETHSKAIKTFNEGIYVLSEKWEISYQAQEICRKKTEHQRTSVRNACFQCNKPRNKVSQKSEVRKACSERKKYDNHAETLESLSAKIQALDIAKKTAIRSYHEIDAIYSKAAIDYYLTLGVWMKIHNFTHYFSTTHDDVEKAHDDVEKAHDYLKRTEIAYTKALDHFNDTDRKHNSLNDKFNLANDNVRRNLLLPLDNALRVKLKASDAFDVASAYKVHSRRTFDYAVFTLNKAIKEANTRRVITIDLVHINVIITIFFIIVIIIVMKYRKYRKQSKSFYRIRKIIRDDRNIQ